mmetsp:Transcript_20448/g.31975  ORF Transcript_20448/g.31975 Transcript_20448/m.31975 type:complete len:312 (+) Transcript_20448:47-982(+)
MSGSVNGHVNPLMALDICETSRTHTPTVTQHTEAPRIRRNSLEDHLSHLAEDTRGMWHSKLLMTGAPHPLTRRRSAAAVSDRFKTKEPACQHAEPIHTKDGSCTKPSTKSSGTGAGEKWGSIVRMQKLAFNPFLVPVGDLCLRSERATQKGSTPNNLEPVDQDGYDDPHAVFELSMKVSVYTQKSSFRLMAMCCLAEFHKDSRTMLARQQRFQRSIELALANDTGELSDEEVVQVRTLFGTVEAKRDCCQGRNPEPGLGGVGAGVRNGRNGPGRTTSAPAVAATQDKSRSKPLVPRLHLSQIGEPCPYAFN